MFTPSGNNVIVPAADHIEDLRHLRSRVDTRRLIMFQIFLFSVLMTCLGSGFVYLATRVSLREDTDSLRRIITEQKIQCAVLAHEVEDLRTRLRP